MLLFCVCYDVDPLVCIPFLLVDSSSLASIPDSVRRSFSFDPTLLSGGSSAVEKSEQIVAGAEEYMKVTDGDEHEQETSSLSKQLKEMVSITRACSIRKRLLQSLYSQSTMRFSFLSGCVEESEGSAA